MEAVTDPREMRKAIRNAAYGSCRLDGEPINYSVSMAASLIRSVQDAGMHQGYNGEDIMTALAYHALRAFEESQDRLLQMYKLSPTPMPIVRAALKKATE